MFDDKCIDCNPNLTESEWDGTYCDIHQKMWDEFDGYDLDADSSQPQLSDNLPH